MRMIACSGAVTVCVDPLDFFMERFYSLPKTLECCRHGLANNVAITNSSSCPVSVELLHYIKTSCKIYEFCIMICWFYYWLLYYTDGWCIVSEDDVLNRVQSLIRSANPDVAFLSADHGLLTRCLNFFLTDSALLLSA